MDSESTIIFKIDIDKEQGGFEKASNFITKICQNELLENKEVKGISSIVYTWNKTSYRDLAQYVLEKKENFRKIKKPENLSAIEKYKVYYCFWIAENALNDVIDLQYEYLIKKFYKNIKIFTILCDEKDMYFKASHYLYSMSQQDKKWYNSFFYKEQNNEKLLLQRLQVNHVYKFNNFMPFQYFDSKQNSLFQSLVDIVKKEIVINAMTKEVDLQSVPVILRAGINIISQAKKQITIEQAEELCDIFGQGSVFAFLVFTYACANNQFWNEFNFEELKIYYFKMKECAAGCEQLMENVVNHSVAAAGGVSVRFHKAEAEYLEKRYNLKNENIAQVEILITDYEGINEKGNIAENYISNLTDAERKKLQEMKPIDFFAETDAQDARQMYVKKAMDEINLNAANIGKHIGLKVFKKIVEENKGKFGFYSHRTHIKKLGENLNYFEYADFCMPGTGYTILFPVKIDKEKELKRAQIGIDFNINLEKNIKEYISGYSCGSVLLDSNIFYYENQKSKEAMIGTLAQKLKMSRYSNEKKRCINYISAKNLNSDVAEFICKALMTASYDYNIPDYIFFDCSKEFVFMFQNTMSIYFENRDWFNLFKNREFVIGLYTEPPIESSFIIPGDYKGTVWANQTNCYSGSEYMGVGWLEKYSELYKFQEDGVREIPPYDIIYKIQDNNTLFERYTLQVLETNIQEKAFGCKITDTHMRLGSTIHIDSFYEAELLFSTRLFANRFAYLLVKDMVENEEFRQARKVTLYSYALYSEMLVVEVIDLLRTLYKDKEIDYAILEREAEHRDFSHIDRIRYGRSFDSEDERKNYFKDRKIICIVPINSTLKTHEKLLSLFMEKNGASCKNNIILNYALVLVGSKRANNYWKIRAGEKTFEKIQLNIVPVPKYFIEVIVEYYEANDCKLCFPENPLDEVPLIEVNAASTIPNQSFGLYKEEKNINLDYKCLEQEEGNLAELKDVLIYSHTMRGENHFLYYFKTDELFVRQKEKITEWLKNIANLVNVKDDEYHILFCPAHYSNAGFAESVNRIIFHDVALLIRVDVDKEYRSNICAKYSNLASLIELLETAGEKEKTIKIYYVDDSIVTGRTFHRAKSLVSSIVGRYKKERKRLDVHIFEKIFVLLDRNSNQSRLQYIGCWDSANKDEEQLEDNFFAYKTLCISSMRSHGDSCILCQLEREATILYTTSATRYMTTYWKQQKQKFEIKYLRDKNEESGVAFSREKSFRRMFCYHVLEKQLLGEMRSNKKEDTMTNILNILIIDYEGRSKNQGSEQAFEYFLSYLKVLSRPFLVFDKTIKEVVFDLQLVLTESLLNNQSLEELLNNCRNKQYLSHYKVLWKHLLTDIINKCFTDKQKADLLKLLLKQLTEMKSNYFIRVENIKKMTEFAKQISEEDRKELYERFLQQTKKLLGVSSDTSKSAWFSHQIYGNENTLGLSANILGRLIIENTRAYFDGIQKLSNTSNSICNEIEKTQYRDFVSVLTDMGIINDDCFTLSGLKEVESAVHLLRICNEVIVNHRNNLSEKPIEENCHEIIDLINDMLQAEKVDLILECPLECDKWEDEIRIKYNELVEEKLDDEIQKESLKIPLKNRKEYLIIASSKRKEDSNSLDWKDIQMIRNADIEEAKRFDAYHKQTDNDGIEGIYVNDKDGYLIWEVGNDEVKLGESRKLLVYAQYDRIALPKEWHRIRNVLSFRNVLQNSVFDSEVIDYFFELILADKRGMFNALDKSHSHTAETIRMAQSSFVRSLKMQEAYHSFAMMLLADLQVSQVYRNSLKADYYQSKAHIYLRSFENVFSIFTKRLISVIVLDQIDTEKGNILNVEVDQKVDSSRKENMLLSYAIAHGENEVFLLLFAIISNAAGIERGKREKQEEEKLGKKITVHITITEKGDLRIENKSTNKIERLEEINEEIHYPPQPNKGISVWSLSRFIKSIISTLLTKHLENLCKQSKIDFEKEREVIEKYMGEAYDIKVGQYQDENNETWFYVDIPILAAKYEDLISI